MELSRTFEADARTAVLDAAETRLVGERNNLIFQAVQRVHDRLRAYGREFDYDVEPVIDSFGGVEVDRSPGQLRIRFGWEHPAIKYFEFGTSEHTIQGDPVLSFVWAADEAPEWVAREFEAEGDGYRVFLPEVEVAGIKESRAVRDAVNWLRTEVRQ